MFSLHILAFLRAPLYLSVFLVHELRAFQIINLHKYNDLNIQMHLCSY